MRRSALVLPLLLVAACHDLTLPLSPNGPNFQVHDAAPAATSNIWIPVDVSVVALCTGEVMAVTGNLHVVSIIWDDSERLRIQSHLNTNLSARGLTTGLRYRIQQITNQMFELDRTSGTSEANQVFHFQVISATTAPNYYLTMNGTWYWDASGNVTVRPKKWELLCR